jgi:hypothetical protein
MTGQSMMAALGGGHFFSRILLWMTLINNNREDAKSESANEQ